MKRPAFQFYPGDWRKDVELRACSIAARGLWIDLMCVMHDCDPYGHLVLNGKPMTTPQIAGQIGLPAVQLNRLMDELIDNGVARKTEEGVIFSQRMVNDERVRNARAEGGKAGGEHGSKGGSHGNKGGRPAKPKGGSETPLPNAEEPPPSSSSSSSSSEEQSTGTTTPQGRVDLTGHLPTPAGAICRALRRAGIGDTNPGHPALQVLLDAGATEAEFLGAVDEARDKGKPFAYLLGVVEGQRKRAASTASQLHRGPMPTAHQDTAAQRAATTAEAARLLGFGTTHQETIDG